MKIHIKIGERTIKLYKHPAMTCFFCCTTESLLHMSFMDDWPAGWHVMENSITPIGNERVYFLYYKKVTKSVTLPQNAAVSPKTNV